MDSNMTNSIYSGMRPKYIFIVRRRLSIPDVFMAMLSMTMLVDFMNGVLPEFHIGEAFRVILLFISSLYIIKYGKRVRGFYFGILVFLFGNLVISFLLHSDGLRTNIGMALKSCIIFAVFFCLITLNMRRRINLSDIERVLKNILYSTPMLYIISYLTNTGRTSYSFGGQALGYKGGFLSLNTVNIALIVLYIFCIDKVFKTREKKWTLFSLYSAFIMLILGTKTAYVIIIAIPGLYILLGITKRKTIKIIAAIVVMILASMWPFIKYVYPMLRGVINRQLFLFEQRSFWTYLTSTRNERIRAMLPYYFKNASPISIITGNGYYWLHNIASGNTSTSGATIPLEMDWADLFVSYGIIGLLFPYCFIIKKIVKNWKARKIKAEGTMYFWTSVLLLLYGSFAGHLFFEALSSTFYGIILAGLCISGQDPGEGIMTGSLGSPIR